ncbi:MAG: terminase large subunit domain-containing protein [Sphingosinicella sp.]|uniref:terminase large subunit domain-containing protein n=1 Tax=Sphingosinicella sp. TaxID=1917971 RepID=UPI004037F668
MKPEPPLPPGTDLVEYLLTLAPELRAAALARLGIEEGETLDRAWPAWAHAGQAPPPGAWRTWVLKAGRGFGKTLAGAKWVTALVAAHDRIDIALVGATLEDARRVMVEGRSGLIEIADAWVTGWCPSLGRLTFRTGATATLFSGATPALLRGPEHHFAWCDELAKWEKPRETWDMLQLGLRLGPNPRALVTTTPRSGPVLAGIMLQPGTVTTGGPSKANPHTSRAWLDNVHALYAGTRLGRQELDGELLPEAGALWSVELLERCRRNSSPRFLGEGDHAQHGGGAPPSALRAATSPANAGEDRFVRLVIGVDPPVADGTCGIIACAKDSAGIAHVLADHSVTARTPEGWSRAGADAARIHSLSSPAFAGEGDHLKGGGGASFPGEGRGPAQHKNWPPAFAGAQLIPLIVAEQNQGGRMVAAILPSARWPDLLRAYSKRPNSSANSRAAVWGLAVTV